MRALFVFLSLALCGAGAFAQTPYDAVKLNEVLANGTILKNANGHGIDIIELYNTGAEAVQLDGTMLTDASAVHPYTFPPNTTIPAGGFIAVQLDPDLPTNAFGISGSGDTVYFRTSDGTPIDSVSFGFQIRDLSLGRFPDGGGAWTLTQTTFGGANVTNALSEPGGFTDSNGLKINEWNAADPFDFIELYNSLTNPVAIGGLVISDAQNNGLTVAENSFLGVGKRDGFLVFRSDENNSSPNFLSFGLGKSGDSITLNRAGTIPDSISFGAQQNDVSQGRLPDGSTNFTSFPKRLTPGSPNFGSLTSLVINELLAHTDPPLEDAVELLNVTDAPLDISGWIMTDDPDRHPNRYVFPPNTIIPAHGFYVLYEYQFRYNSTPSDYTFNSAHGDTNFILQVDANTNIVAYLEQRFGPSANGVSFGRITNSDGDIDFVPMECRSFGKDYNLPAGTKGLGVFRQGTGAPNSCLPKWGPVIISEIMYHPPDIFGTNNVLDEYLELRNVTSVSQPLFDPNAKTNHYRIEGAGAFEFTENDSIEPNGYLLLVGFDPIGNPGQLAEFRSRYTNLPVNVPIRGPYTNRLGNGDDIVALFRPDPPQGANHIEDFTNGYVPFIQIDRVHYEPGINWPTNADGTGLSMQRINASGYADEPLSWFDDIPTPGRANDYQLVIMQQPQNTPMLNGSTGSLSVVVATQPEGTNGTAPGYQWYFKNKVLAGATSSTLQFTNVSRKNAGAYACVISNYSGRIMSQSATVTAILPVSIKSPKSRTVADGAAKAVFKVVPKGTKPFTFQWYFNEASLDGATNGTLTIMPVNGSKAGSYTVVVGNVLSGVTSAPAILTVTPPK